MSTLTVLPSGKTTQVASGTSLLEAIRASGAPFKSGCKDSTCDGSCHVYVTEGKKSLSKLLSTENEKLDTIPGITSKSRLSCQTRIGEENVTIEIPGFD